MTYKWCKCTFTADEMNGRTVNFSVPLEQGGVVTGVGTLQAKQNSEGLVAVRILQQFRTIDGPFSVNAINVPVEAMDKLVKNPPGSAYVFTINAV